MLNLFPIMFLSMFAHALLRLTVGSIFVYLGFKHCRGKRSTLIYTIALFEFVIGGMFILGLLTQAAALGGVAFSLAGLFFSRKLPLTDLPGKLFFFLLLGASLSLLITGAGAFAFDLPI